MIDGQDRADLEIRRGEQRESLENSEPRTDGGLCAADAAAVLQPDGD